MSWKHEVLEFEIKKFQAWKVLEFRNFNKVMEESMEFKTIKINDGLMVMAPSLQTRFVGKVMVSSCMLVGGCRNRFLMRTPYCTLDRQRFGMSIVGMLPAVSACCVFHLQLDASLPLCLELTAGFSQ